MADEAQAPIAAIRASPPARRVHGAAGNVSGVYPRRKMGWSTQFESHWVELPGVIATGRLWVDPRRVPLVTPAEVRVFSDEPLGRTYAAACESVAAPRKAARPTNAHVGNLVRDERGEPAEEDSATDPRAAIRALLHGESHTALAAALRRHAYQSEKAPDGPGRNARTLRSWHAQLRG